MNMRIQGFTGVYMGEHENMGDMRIQGFNTWVNMRIQGFTGVYMGDT